VAVSTEQAATARGWRILTTDRVTTEPIGGDGVTRTTTKTEYEAETVSGVDVGGHNAVRRVAGTSLEDLLFRIDEFDRNAGRL
jgi:hypothetical protein